MSIHHIRPENLAVFDPLRAYWAYVEGWLEAMKEDSRAIFRAASEAQKAVDYIMGRTAQADQMAAE